MKKSPQKHLLKFFALSLSMILLISLVILCIIRLDASTVSVLTEEVDTSSLTSPSGDTGAAGDAVNLPKAGGISASTMIGLFGLALIVSGITAVTILRKKNTGKSK